MTAPNAADGRQFAQRLVDEKGWTLKEFTLDEIMADGATVVNPPADTLHYVFLQDGATYRNMCQHLSNKKILDRPGDDWKKIMAGIHMFVGPGPNFAFTVSLSIRLASMLGMNKDEKCYICMELINYNGENKFRPDMQCHHCVNLVCKSCMIKYLETYADSLVDILGKVDEIVVNLRCAACKNWLPSSCYDFVGSVIADHPKILSQLSGVM